MLLSRIGGPKQGEAAWEDCEDVSPSDDKVITEVAMRAHETEGISGIKVTFSSDYPNQNENTSDENLLQEEEFKFGNMEEQPDNFEISFKDIS